MKQPGYHKGELCPYAEKAGGDPLLCQEGFCRSCQIWHDFGTMKETGVAKGEAEECPKLNDSGPVLSVMRTMAYSEKRYCPICKQKTTFICQTSGCFCSVCGYRGKGEAESIKENVDAR